MDDSISTQVAFELILHAGNARSLAMESIYCCREYKFKEADELLEKAKIEMQLAHQTQTSLLQEEAKGEKTDICLLLIHAQDHLTMAMIALTDAEEFYALYQEIHSTKESLDLLKKKEV